MKKIDDTWSVEAKIMIGFFTVAFICSLIGLLVSAIIGAEKAIPIFGIASVVSVNVALFLVCVLDRMKKSPETLDEYIKQKEAEHGKE